MSEETQITEKKGEAVVPEQMEDEALFAPQVDIVEKNDAIIVVADMPGVSRENVEVILEEGTLAITGKTEEEKEPEMTCDLAEYEVGGFHRRFTVGEGLDTDNVAAKMKDGVLRLTIPKSAQHKRRTIEIQGD